MDDKVFRKKKLLIVLAVLVLLGLAAFAQEILPTLTAASPELTAKVKAVFKDDSLIVQEDTSKTAMYKIIISKPLDDKGQKQYICLGRNCPNKQTTTTTTTTTTPNQFVE